MENDFECAAQDCYNAIRLEPKPESLWNERCWVRAILGQLQAARLDCDAALLLRPNYAAASTHEAWFI